jgi:hypothetical protein
MKVSHGGIYHRAVLSLIGERMLPVWYIKKHRTQVGGLRLFKMKMIRVGAPAMVVVAPAIRGEKDFAAGVDGGRAGWVHWEYRYWMCELDKGLKPDFGVCRRCGASFVSHAARREHGANNKCSMVLTAAYKKLINAEAKCIVCNRSTTNQCFGMYLCGTLCKTNFFYETFTPEALKAAVQLVEREME